MVVKIKSEWNDGPGWLLPWPTAARTGPSNPWPWKDSTGLENGWNYEELWGDILKLSHGIWYLELKSLFLHRLKWNFSKRTNDLRKGKPEGLKQKQMTCWHFWTDVCFVLSARSQFFNERLNRTEKAHSWVSPLVCVFEQVWRHQRLRKSQLRREQVSDTFKCFHLICSLVTSSTVGGFCLHSWRTHRKSRKLLSERGRPSITGCRWDHALWGGATRYVHPPPPPCLWPRSNEILFDTIVNIVIKIINV